MDARKVLTKKTNAAWREALERRTDECFARNLDGWTLGQVSDHVTQVSLAFLASAEALTRGEGEERAGGLMPAIMLGLGSFPPMRIKVPSNLPPEYANFARPGQLTKAESLERFASVERGHRDLCDAVAAAPAKLRSKHPAAGWLNAAGWYQISEMHMRHHLRQLRRIEKELEAS